MEQHEAQTLLEKANCIIEKMEDLLARSEARIEQTNHMVQDLSNCMKSLNSAYIHHIDQAVDNNRSLIQQNQELIKQIASSQETIRKEAEKYDRLMESLLQMIKPAPHVNINQ